MSDKELYGAVRPTSVCHQLRAGPVSVKFEEGELRYLTVGNKEILRRIYFAVRDVLWDTAMPKFSKLQVREDTDGFAIDLEAVCRNDRAHYGWKGRIEGTRDGVIKFSVAGEALADFESPRIGICVLYGAESLAGQDYEITAQDDSNQSLVFPHLVSPTLIAEDYRCLRFRTAGGVEVSGELAEGLFRMEDQRNFGDSSYKAFCGHPFTDPNIKTGHKGTQTFTLTVKQAGASESRSTGPVRVVMGDSKSGKVPRLLPLSASEPGEQEFAGVNRGRDKFMDQDRIAFRFTPTAHLWDDDTLMENTSAIIDEVKTVRSFRPDVAVRIDPVLIETNYPRPARDARNKGLFAAAWCARMLKHLAVSGADEAVFDIDGPYARVVLDMLGDQAGKELIPTDIGPHEPLDAFAIADGSRRALWLINKTGEKQQLVVTLEQSDKAIELQRLGADGPPAPSSGSAQPAADGTLTLDLEPLEVVIATI